MKLYHADCLVKLRELETSSLDSMVTDPPAGIAFMGKGWDTDKGGREFWIAWLTEVMTEACRVLKPGSHALVWAIPRTSHWTMTALENAGFEIRDVVTHLFGSGFPKSLDVSKAIDKAAGAERNVIGTVEKTPSAAKCHEGWERPWAEGKTTMDITAPATPDAEKWQGFGTALKPACEFWILCRKPLGEKTVAANVLKHGTGALNIDGCRIGSDVITTQGYRNGENGSWSKQGMYADDAKYTPKEHVGRFPANLVLSHSDGCKLVGTKQVGKGQAKLNSETGRTAISTRAHNERQPNQSGSVCSYGEETVEAWECEPDCAVRMLDEQSGPRPGDSPNRKPRKNSAANGGEIFKSTADWETTGHSDAGGASRFFYCAKASRSDRQRKATDDGK